MIKREQRIFLGSDVEPFAFQTDERSVKRKIFEEEVMMKNAAYEELRQERQAEKLAKEELEIKRMREETVHKAQPVPK